MANPDILDIPETGTPPIYLDKHFLQYFHDMDDAIRHENLEKLRRHVKESEEARPVNLSLDPLLSVVIARGKSKLAIELLEEMSLKKLEAPNLIGDTALHVAVARGDESVVEALVEKNRDLLEARNKQLEIPLHKAALFGQRQIFWKLVQHGSDAHARKKGGATMLHCAVMGNAPELALEITKKYPELMLRRNDAAVTPLQLVVTIPEALRSQLHLGPLESLIYEWIPLEEKHEKHVEELEELSVHQSSDPRYKDDECLQLVITSRRKFPHNYATFFDMLELACIPVSTRVQDLELLKKNHKQAMELIAYLAKDPGYWDFIAKGRTPNTSQISTIPSGTSPISTTLPDTGEHISSTTLPDTGENISSTTLPDTGENISSTTLPKTGDASKSDENLPKQGKERTKDSKGNRWNESPLILGSEMGLREFVKQILTVCQAYAGYLDTEGRNSKGNRWNESPLILGAEMGLHEFVKQILTVCPASAGYLDTEGRNVLQVAIQNGQEKIVEIIESMASGSNPVLPSWLLSGIEEKTKNTILHFAAAETVQENYPAIQMQHELQWFERVKGLVRKDLEYSRNEEEKTAQELFNEKHKTMVEKGKEQLMEMGKTCSSLVAAVVFASSFSIPGEKDANNNPVFLHKTAFKVFSHAYVIGLSCASTALVLFLSFLTSPYRVQDFRRSLPTKYFFANVSFFLALVALLVAFTCNIYLNIYGGRKAETKDIVPLVCELTIFPTVCIFVLLYRGSTFGFGSFMRHVWR